MKHELVKAYRQMREPRFSESFPGKPFFTSSKTALHQARAVLEDNRTVKAWDAVGGESMPGYKALSNWEPGSPRVRIVEWPDCYSTWDDLTGDCFSPNANPDIHPAILKRQEEKFRDKIDRDGVWEYSAQVWNGADWEIADSIGGFVGDDFANSGYMPDLMRSALDRLEEILTNEAGRLESSRGDLYGAHTDG